jgi:hypothetical protein
MTLRRQARWATMASDQKVNKTEDLTYINIGDTYKALVANHGIYTRMKTELVTHVQLYYREAGSW